MNGVATWGTVALAVGTAILAVATLRMARATARSATATEESAGAAEKTAGAAERAAKAAEAAGNMAEKEIELTRGNLQAVERQAAASADQLLLAQQAFEASVLPILAEEPGSIAVGPNPIRYPHSDYGKQFGNAEVEVVDLADGTHVSIPLRNVGPGIAVITSAGLSPPGSVHAAFTRNIVPSGESVRFLFTVPRANADARPILESIDSGTLSVTVGYHDATGRQDLIGRADLHVGGRGWFIRQISVRRRADEEPFIMSGPSDA
jgi:hypothetical protein